MVKKLTGSLEPNKMNLRIKLPNTGGDSDDDHHQVKKTLFTYNNNKPLCNKTYINKWLFVDSYLSLTCDLIKKMVC